MKLNKSLMVLVALVGVVSFVHGATNKQLERMLDVTAQRGGGDVKKQKRLKEIIHKSILAQEMTNLSNNMMRYAPEDNYVHQGTVYQHSLWVARTMAQWINEHNQWTKGISADRKRLLCLAAFLHDTGKCGDGVFSFVSKDDHPRNGASYLLGDKEYLIDGQRALKRSWFHNLIVQRLGFSENEFKIITILIAMHHLLGNLMQKGAPLIEDCTKHLKKLATCARVVGYKPPQNELLYDQIVDQELLLIVTLIGAADVKGFCKADYKNGMFGDADFDQWWGDSSSNNIKKPLYDSTDMNGYTDWKYETLGIKCRELLLQAFKQNAKKFSGSIGIKPKISGQIPYERANVRESEDTLRMKGKKMKDPKKWGEAEDII